MRETNPNRLRRAEVLNTVFRERPKHLALAWSHLGDFQAAERVFQELLAALDRREEPFFSRNALRAWGWKGLRNRCVNLVRRGDGRAITLSRSVQAEVDDELSCRDARSITDQCDALRICLSSLSARAKWVVHACYARGRRGLPASRLLNVTPEQLYRELQKIYAHLHKCCSKRIAMGRAPLGRASAPDPEFERRVFRYLDGEITPEETAELDAELEKNRDRVGEFNDIRLYSVLLRHEDTLAACRASGPDTPPSRRYPDGQRRLGALALSVLAAASIVSGVVGIFSMISLGEADRPPATFLRGTDVKFANREVPEIGSTLEAGDYELTRGTIRLHFAKGAEVNFEAPAEFTIRDAEHVVLRRGRLLAMVSRPAVGFQVSTDLMAIRDLGTEFGVTARPDRSVDVVVFDGKVEVTPGEERPQILAEGDGLRVSGRGTERLVASQESYRYPRTVPMAESAATPGNLLRNPSFETGPLSRTPHAGHQYRDTPSYWSAGRIAHGRWSELGQLIRVGTVVASPQPSAQLSPAHRDRFLSLRNAAVRQKIGAFRPGKQYCLTVQIASPGGADSKSAPALPAQFRLGLMADDQWLDAESGSLESGSGFVERTFDFELPKRSPSVEAPLFLVLSSARGTLFFDEARLAELPPSR